MGDALTIEFNASADLRDGSATAEEIAPEPAEAKAEFIAPAELPRSTVTPATRAVARHLSSPHEEASIPFDGTYHELVSRVGAACMAAGTDLVVGAERGG